MAELLLYSPVLEATFEIETLQAGEAIGTPPLSAYRDIILEAKPAVPAVRRRFRLRFNFYPDARSAMAMVNPISRHTIGVGEVWVGGDLFQESRPGSGIFDSPVIGKAVQILVDGRDTGKRPVTQAMPPGHFWDRIHDVLDRLSPGTHRVTVRFTG